MERKDTLPERWLYLVGILDNISSEVRYWTSKLEKGIEKVEDELRIRTRVYDLLDRYTGALSNPDGIAHIMTSDTDSELKKKAKTIVEERGRDLLELSEKYRRTLKTRWLSLTRKSNEKN